MNPFYWGLVWNFDLFIWEGLISRVPDSAKLYALACMVDATPTTYRHLSLG